MKCPNCLTYIKDSNSGVLCKEYHLCSVRCFLHYFTLEDLNKMYNSPFKSKEDLQTSMKGYLFY